MFIIIIILQIIDLHCKFSGTSAISSVFVCVRVCISAHTLPLYMMQRRASDA